MRIKVLTFNAFTVVWLWHLVQRSARLHLRGLPLSYSHWVSISKYFNRTSRPSWGTPGALGTDAAGLSYILYFLICIQYAKALLFYAVTPIFAQFTKSLHKWTIILKSFIRQKRLKVAYQRLSYPRKIKCKEFLLLGLSRINPSLYLPGSMNSWGKLSTWQHIFYSSYPICLSDWNGWLDEA